MDLKDVMQQRCFAVVGDTLHEEKTAYQIKKGMQERGYTVYPVGKELASLNDIPEEIDVIDLCIHPSKGLRLLQECQKKFQMIVLQPGSADDTLRAYLDQNHLPYLDGCLLVGMSLYPKNS